MYDKDLETIITVDIEKEMKKSYIDYAMSVIVGRALPDVRDGLKPVHRRILYAMYEANLTPSKPYRKAATTVGDVLGKYHPHGDASVYDAMVRMAQDFSLRYPLIDGHGNFGSIDGDAPAAYRYTEARLAKLSMDMLTDIEKDTVEFVPNYDDKETEPSVLPSRFPQLLVNGSNGIAVGMATNMPPHNLTEVIDGIIAVMDDPLISFDELMTYIKGPDFPTGGLILGKSGIRAAYHTGRGKIIMRARASIEPKDANRDQIIVTEIPYMVNKARLIEKIAELVHEKRIEGISDLRDESDKEGLRIVIELKRDANANVVLNNLYKNTQLQDSFSVINLALVDNKPKVLNLREIIDNYIAFQKEVIVRRTRFELDKALKRAHILEGLLIVIENIDETIAIIKRSKDPAEAKINLMERFGISDIQAQAIVDMRLGRLTGLEREKIENEYKELMEQIEDLNDILAKDERVCTIVKQDLTEIKERCGDERRTEIVAMENEIDIEDLIEEEDCAVTLTHFGYVKRMSVSAYKSQHRGGRGISGLSTREEDFVEKLFVTSTHDYIMFFTNKGRVYRLKCYELPLAGRGAKGAAIVNLLEIEKDERITAVMTTREYEDDKYVMFITKQGVTKRTELTEFSNCRKSGLIAIRLDEEDELIGAYITGGSDEVIVGTKNGMAIRFNEGDVRCMRRSTRGVRAIDLGEGDEVVGMSIAMDDAALLTVTENGYGKKTEVEQYRLQSRGGKGILNYRLSDDTGSVVALLPVSNADDLMLITNEGVVIRMDAGEISTVGRVTKGVRLMRLTDNVKIVSATAAAKEDEDESEGEEAETEVIDCPEEEE
jgi:DNA gyrase subunit A